MEGIWHPGGSACAGPDNGAVETGMVFSLTHLKQRAF